MNLSALVKNYHSYFYFYLALLEKLQSETASNGTAGNSEHVRKRRRTNSGHRNQTGDKEENEEPKEVNYTQEQVQAVLR